MRHVTSPFVISTHKHLTTHSLLSLLPLLLLLKTSSVCLKVSPLSHTITTNYSTPPCSSPSSSLFNIFFSLYINNTQVPYSFLFPSTHLHTTTMGLGGTLEYLSDMLGCAHNHKKKKKKQLNTVELKVRMDCEGCELKVKKALSSMKGVQKVDINRKQQKVTVVGFVEQNKVLKKAQSTGKKAEIWPYVPYGLVTQPYAAQAYDKKAPPGFVRNVEVLNASSQPVRQEDQMTNMFSDENPNSCSIM